MGILHLTMHDTQYGINMFSKYKAFMEQYVSLNLAEWNIVRTKLKLQHYQKGEIIHHVGDICTQLMFINSGLARAFIIDENGKDSTWAIFFNDENANMTNLFVVDYESFINHKESKLEIVALEDCEVVVMNFEDVAFLYDNAKKGNIFGRLMAEAAYSYLHDLVIQRQTLTAKERFEHFIRETPHLLEKVPQYHIASFLGVTPQHLSRLKKEYKHNAL